MTDSLGNAATYNMHTYPAVSLTPIVEPAWPAPARPSSPPMAPTTGYTFSLKTNLSEGAITPTGGVSTAGRPKVSSMSSRSATLWRHRNRHRSGRPRSHDRTGLPRHLPVRPRAALCLRGRNRHWLHLEQAHQLLGLHARWTAPTIPESLAAASMSLA